MSRTLDELRKLVRRADVSRYAISKATGIDQGVLSKFVHGTRNLSVDSAERLADYFGFKVTLQPKRRSKRK